MALEKGMKVTMRRNRRQKRRMKQMRSPDCFALADAIAALKDNINHIGDVTQFVFYTCFTI